jgi:hypothetical protein
MAEYVTPTGYPSGESPTSRMPPQPAAVPAASGYDHSHDPEPTELKIVSHSPLFYWWPVWVLGYVFAGITWWYGDTMQIGDGEIRIHPAGALGVVFFLTLFLVVAITNISIRGYMSLVVVSLFVTLSVILAYFGFWGPIFGWIGDLNVYLNQGGYFWFSTLLFAVWAITVFGVDRMSYWHVKPGQITRVKVFGTASRSYDTENLFLEKRRDEVFRHWILGLGSGDLKIQTHGARAEEFVIPNVLFIGSKVETIQRLIASQPDTHALGH